MGTRTYKGYFQMEIDETDTIDDILKAISKQWGIKFQEVEEGEL